MAAGYSVTISAVDGATGVINRVNTGLEGLSRRVAQVRAPFERFNAAVGKLGDTTGITRLSGAVADLERRAVGMAASLGRFAPALGAIAGGGAIASVARMVSQFGEMGTRLGFASQRIGINATQLQGWQGAAVLAGSSADALTGGLTALQDHLTNAAAGRDPQFVQMMAALGESFVDARTGGVRLAQDALGPIADRIAALRNPTQQALIATEAFGAAGESLLPLLRTGSAGIRELTGAAQRYGAISPARVEAARQWTVAQNKLGLAFAGVGNAIGEKVTPVLTPMLTRLADFLGDERHDIAKFFQHAAETLRRWVDSGGMQRVLDWLERAGRNIERLVDTFGGWQNAAVALALTLNSGLLASVINLVAQVTRLATVVGVTLVEAFGAAGTAAELFNARTMKLPVFAALTATLGVFNKISGGIPVDQLPERQRQLLGLPEAGSPSAGDRRSWWERHAPSWLGGQSGPLESRDRAEDYSWLGRFTPGPGATRGLRNRNPLNLSYLPNQPGVIGSDGRFGRFPDLATGVAADVRQMLHDENRGQTTLTSLIAGRLDPDGQRRFGWAPGGENDAGSYISRVAGELGIDPNAPLNYHDAGFTSRLVQAMSYVENGPRTSLPGGDVLLGVNRALGLPETASPVATIGGPGAAGAAGPDGRVTVRVELPNAPTGTRATTIASGDGLRVERAQIGLGSRP